MRSGQFNKIHFRKNEQIASSSLRVIGADGKQIGILTREEALAKAQEQELDLVEIAPKANPPVAKIIDFSKLLYEQEKKERAERKSAKKGSALKEIWFTAFIAENDYLTRLERTKEFLGEGAKVRIAIKSKKRLNNNQPLFNMINRVVGDLSAVARPEQPPKMFGRQLICTLAPSGGNVENAKNEI
ncbi:translation initiation factor IF-3 [Candidatus Microgenomates bacterium]|nr:translation initiation factor IF-3 [Candidatus Microgenomates bacterium]